MDTDMLKLLYERSDALNGCWNLYMAVALGLLGLLASGKDFTASRRMKGLLTGALVVFAVSNLTAIHSIIGEREAIAKLIDKSLLGAAKPAQPYNFCVYAAYHGVVDLLVVLSFWWVPWRARDKAVDE